LQDYVYLFEYAKVFALGFLKTDNITLQKYFLQGQNDVFKELEIHKKYMLDMKIDEDKIKNLKPSIYNTAYTKYMLSVGFSGDENEIIATILPCAWSYFYIAKNLKQTYKNSGFYNHWIDSYNSGEYYESWQWMNIYVNEKSYTKEKLEKMCEIFLSSSEFEYMFWDMDYDKKLSV
jgi:thiaminase/transcriptional activator TenA